MCVKKHVKIEIPLHETECSRKGCFAKVYYLNAM